ncbi:hypothetical protein M569_06543, partial [Genlisea aurea]
MAAVSGGEEVDEWELVNDDGFVYRRRKRQRIEATAAKTLPLDAASESRNRRERRKRVLRKLRDKYLAEMSQWELLSNALREMEPSASERGLEPPLSSTKFEATFRSGEHTASDLPRRSLINDLQTQIEGQEAIIEEVSKLCDVAEALCSAAEERKKQQLLTLPIWDPSPQQLLGVL